MSVKEGNKRFMITLSPSEYQRLKIIMFDLKTRQISKAIKYLINLYKLDV